MPTDYLYVKEHLVEKAQEWGMGSRLSDERDNGGYGGEFIRVCVLPLPRSFSLVRGSGLNTFVLVFKETLGLELPLPGDCCSSGQWNAEAGTLSPGPLLSVSHFLKQAWRQ